MTSNRLLKGFRAPGRLGSTPGGFSKAGPRLGRGARDMSARKKVGRVGTPKTGPAKTRTLRVGRSRRGRRKWAVGEAAKVEAHKEYEGCKILRTRRTARGGVKSVGHTEGQILASKTNLVSGLSEKGRYGLC